LQTRPRTGKWEIGIQREGSQTAPDQFCFLNQERRIESWNDPGITKLWLYSLHYFESPTADLIRKWIAENPVGVGNGWEPYPLSLRICNWIKWSLAGNPLDPSALESLALQARFLAETVEYHLLGNHLLANAKALVFAGAFFEGGPAEEWLSSGLRILASQLPEQVLDDGGHFERSPMYHSLILEDVLDLINLHRTWPDLLPDWSDVAGRMLGWLENMTHPDGRIAFFNDAAFGVAPTVNALTDYAKCLAIHPNRLPLGDSGYIRLENDQCVVLFDAAPIGPDYQPGHAHADTLSFELTHHGKRVVVNSGTSTYEVGAERKHQRGTAAHNTVRIDGIDQSEVWASFRVARRAYPFDVKTDHQSFAEAAHDGYRRLRNPVIHRRRLELRSDGLAVTDMVEGTGEHEIEVFFHLHPGVESDITLDPKLSKSREETMYHPEFNLSIPNTTIVGRFKGAAPAMFRSFIPLRAKWIPRFRRRHTRPDATWPDFREPGRTFCGENCGDST
jgi:uncharacterized heparinase superfamily protein